MNTMPKNVYCELALNNIYEKACKRIKKEQASLNKNLTIKL